MGKFVNYNKRSVALPPGCKDLLDVMHQVPKRKSNQVMASQWVQVPKPERIPTHGLDHILRFMAQVLESTTKFTSLCIALPDNDTAISVYRHTDPETLSLMLFFHRNTEEERAIRAFFAEHQIDHMVDLGRYVEPTSVRGLQYPLPRDAAAAAALVRDFLRTVHGLTEEAGIDFTIEKHERAGRGRGAS